MTAAAAPSQPTRRWLTKLEAAEYLRLSERSIKRAMADGSLPYHKFRALVRFDVRDLDAYAESHRIDSRDG